MQNKRVIVTLWWSATALIHHSSLNPGETITSEKYTQQISEMHQKRQCLRSASVNRKGPIFLQDAQQHVAQPLQKLNEWGYKVLLNLPYSPDLSPTDYHFNILTIFLQGKCFHSEQEARVHRILRYEFLCYKNKQTYFSLAKMC